MSVDTKPATKPSLNPQRYFEHVEAKRQAFAAAEPVCLYIETTNRCNLLCTTCPRTFEALEPPGDMSWEMFTSIVDQFPDIARVVLHGVGEPMMVPHLPRMIRYLKDRGTYVLFNTNGTLLSRRKGKELIDSGLDELRISLDAAEAKTFALVRGRDMFDRIVRKVRAFTAMQKELEATSPRTSLWLTGLKETIDQLPDFVRLAHEIGVGEVHLQRLVYFSHGQGLARPESALFEQLDGREGELIQAADALAKSLGIMFNASGATEPGTSLKRQEDNQPWSLCRRPWTLMYFTAHGKALPCCIAPFSMRGYDSFTLGDATQQSLREIWNGQRYQDFRGALLSDKPPSACANCGLRWSL
ncbi:MAG TPA: radical SAM protein [Stellaceae bacterium]|nr:radical SAM protein [Stellaceae bacterium]